MSAFDEVGNKILGRSATEMVRLKDDDYVAYQNAFKDAYFHSYTFKCKAKMESYNVSIPMSNNFWERSESKWSMRMFSYSRKHKGQSIQSLKRPQWIM
jgi:hypothetical protein